ncbi:MAG: efflux RND transporter periplasmic adaptor subunit [Bacteroidales bacterium]|nr:efflux RND transporter periplasmic adaptor subunit [Bacteroidales bacterium]
MKKTIITTGVVAGLIIISLVVINKIFTREDTAGMFAEVLYGNFEISLTTSGELIAENSVEIKGPAIAQRRNVRSTNLKITDLVPEGTEVEEGDYVATLDRTEFDNTLKDYRERLVSLYSRLEMILLDTAVLMNNLRDQISNQIHTVEEAKITLQNSTYEPPATIRVAEINLDKAQRVLEQLQRSYTLQEAQSRITVRNQRTQIDRFERMVEDYEDVLKGFIITAPSPGMVIYKKDRRGNKVRVGSSISPQDRTVATLPDLSSMLSKVFVSEIEVSKIKPGQSVNITVDAFPVKSYTGTIMSIANIGEILANTDSKVFEVLIKVDGSDFALRPSMTTSNKIIINTFNNVAYVPKDCVHTGIDSIPVVYTKNGLKQVVILGEMNDRDVVIEKGLEPGTIVYVTTPTDTEKFRISGEDLIETIRQRGNITETLDTRTAGTLGKPDLNGLN